MIIKKNRNDYDSYNIEIIDENKILVIQQSGDDNTLYVRYQDYSRVSEMDFVIPESENELYPLFENLYERIVSGNVMGWDVSHPATQERMATETSTMWYKDTVKDGVITIMCDAYPVSCPNILTIKKVEDAIVLGFQKVENEQREYKSKFSISINVRQSGSRIYDLAQPFKLLFGELQLINIPDVKEKKLGTNSQ